MSIDNRILYIPEVEAIIFSNLDPLTDFKAMSLVSHYYYQIANQNELYTELKIFCLNRQTELESLRYYYAYQFDKIHIEFTRACYYGKMLVAKYIYSKHNINLHTGDEWAFRWACKKGHIEVAKWLFEQDPKIDIHACSEWAFQGACENGHMEVAKWLFELDHKHRVDIHKYNELAFRLTCRNGHLEVAKWLIELDHKIDIHVNDNEVFKYGHSEVVGWLATLWTNEKIDDTN